MALHKRADVWWIDIYHKGHRIRQSTKTTVKEEAQEVHDKIKSDLWKMVHLKKKPKVPWTDAVVRWVKESQHKRSLDMDIMHLKWMDKFLRKKFIADISSEVIEHLAKEKEKTGVTPTSVNRMLEVLRAILNRAYKVWGWLESPPIVRMRKVENKRIRWLTRAQAKRLIEELPPHLKSMARFALITGLRESNVTQLKWTQIDLSRKHALIDPEQSKTKKAIPVPLSDEAIEIINAQKGKHKEYVFTYRGNPVLRANNHAWRNALERAGIKDFRWHDLRHTWASWHVQSGTSLHELQQLGGWSNYETVLRYAHLSSDHLKEAASRVFVYDTFMSQ